MTVRGTLKREARIALSTKAQPVWFRLVKWMAIVAIGVVFWRSVYFWLGLLGALVLGLLLHLFWRWKTKGWTQPWGGWNDLDTGRKD